MKEPVPLTDSEIRGIRYCLRNPTGDKRLKINGHL